MQTFTIDQDGKEVVVEVRKPSGKIISDGQMIHASEWQKAINQGLILRDRLEDVMRKQGLWDDDKEVERDNLRKTILEHERILKAGGISLKQAREVALKMIKDREAMRKLVAPISRLDNNTAEAHADNSQFNYFVSQCCRYVNKGAANNKCFLDYEDYLSKIDTDLASKCATALMKELYPNYDENADDKLPEIQFLKKWKFIDDKNNLLNDKKQRVDEDGRLINEEGKYIDEDGNFVDDQGYRVDDKGEYIVDVKPFLDDEGKPILEQVEHVEEAKEEKEVAAPVAIA